MPCLSDETIQSFVQRALPPEAEHAVEEHCATCSSCRRLLAEVARSVLSDDGGAGPTKDQAEQRIDRYVVLEPIGQGSSAIVYAARDTSLGRNVALKLLRSPTDNARRRLLREARAMARLTHPNVVTVYDAGTWEESQVFVAMELIVGQTLRAWRRNGDPSQRQVLEVCLAAGRGLAAAHAAGIIHRDFKPDNVLVGNNGRVLVTDFGLARPIAAERAKGAEPIELDPTTGNVLRSLTRPGALVGTPAYMAPEQFGDSTADVRTDVFSFCVTLYEALYGFRPFHGATLDQLVLSTLRGDVTIPKHAENDVLARAIVQGLDYDPARRHQSVDPLLDIMESALRRPTTPRMNARRVAMAASFAVFAAGVVAVLTRSGPPSEAAPSPSEPVAASVARTEPRPVPPPIAPVAPVAPVASVASTPAAPPPTVAEPTPRPAVTVRVPGRTPERRRAGAVPATAAAGATEPSSRPRPTNDDRALITDPWSPR